MRVDSALQQAAIDAVSRGARAAGVDFSALLETAKRESGLDKNARAATSTAAGLFQFIESTWLQMVQQHGGKYGVSVGDLKNGAERKRVLDLRFDPEIAAGMAGELTRENSANLEKKLGRAPSDSELYAAHVLGPEGAASLITAPAGANAAAILPKAAGANRTIFYAEGGAPRSAQDVLARLRLDPSSTPPPAAPAPSDKSSDPLSFASLLALTGLGDSLSGGLGNGLGGGLGQELWALALKAYRSDSKP